MRFANPFRPGGPGLRAPSSLLPTTVAVIAAGFLIVRLADVILLIFASVLLAMFFVALAEPLERRARIGRPLALTAVLVVLLSLAVLLSWLFGAQLSDQLASLSVLLPRSWHAFESRLGESEIGRLALGQIRSAKWPDNIALTAATRFLGNTAAALGSVVIVVAGAIYLAFHPETYAGGLLKLLPPPSRARAAQVMDAARRALTQWLIGQAISMLFVAVAASLGLWLAGVPSPFALGVLAGLGQIVPVIGPWATAVPAMLLALAQGPGTLGFAFLVYMITTQVECNLLTPWVLRRMSELPMAVTLFAVVAMGMLFGPLGVLLATPLSMLAYVLVRTVYIEDVLGDRAGSAAAQLRAEAGPPGGEP